MKQTIEVRKKRQDTEDLLWLCMESLHGVLNKLSVHTPAPAKQTIEQYHQLPKNDQVAIIDMLQKYVKILVADSQPERHRSPSNKDIEIERLLRAAAEFGMRFCDESVFSQIQDGDVVEIYNTHERQIYRNLLFCKLSSYSLLDVAVYRWQDLYDRPHHSIQAIHNHVIKNFTTPVLTQKYDVAKHVLREKFIYARNPRTFLMQMKFLSPLESLETQARIGVISIAKVKLMAGLTDQKKIEIL
jgi:hypothetical protein